jgi:hypothetical protein
VDRHLRQSGDKIGWTLYVNGELTDSEDPVTVQIKDGAGVNVGSSATATNVSTGVYEHQPTATQMDKLDIYSATWTYVLNGESREAPTYYEVVGGTLFAVAEARAFRPELTDGVPIGKLANDTLYPTQAIVDARGEIQDLLQEILGYPVTLRGKREVLDGDHTSELALAETRVGTIYSVAETDSAGGVTQYTEEQLLDLQVTPYGFIKRKRLGVFTSGYGNLAIHYAHGLTSVPGPLKRAGLILLYNRLVGSDISDRAQSFTNEAGTLAYATPNGINKFTGLPEVDAILAKYADNRVGIA